MNLSKFQSDISGEQRCLHHYLFKDNEVRYIPFTFNKQVCKSAHRERSIFGSFKSLRDGSAIAFARPKLWKGIERIQRFLYHITHGLSIFWRFNVGVIEVSESEV